MTAVTSTGVSTGVFDVWLSNKHWSGTTLTYSFPTDGSTYSYRSTSSVTPLSQSQQTAVRQVMDDIASFTGLSFTEVGETAATQGDLRFGRDITDGGAYAYLPSSAERGGDAFFGPATDNPQIGNESFVFFPHEIGHSMGLDHGHEFNSFKNSGFDSQEFTVMTYTDYVGDTDTFSYDSGPVDWAQSYMQLDIAALQFLYGANYARSGQDWSGDTSYTFNPTTGEMTINGVGQGTPAGNRLFRTIWDGDGNDTYDLSNYDTDLMIDLTPGGWSVFSTAQLADLNRNSASTIYDARGNLANALLVDGDRRALIENAIGGSGDDTISGNAADNLLKGKGGSDTLKGKAGADSLLGLSGRDLLQGGSGADTLEGGKGKDRLSGGNGRDTLSGGDGNDRLIGGVGKDSLTGGAGDDTFVFNRVSHSLTGKKSDTIMDFTSGADTLDLGNLTPATFTLSLSGSFTGTGPSVITKSANGNTRVLVDVDGDGNADFRVILDGTGALMAGDFIL